jgi:hypothetical protein
LLAAPVSTFQFSISGSGSSILVSGLAVIRARAAGDQKSRKGNNQPFKR